MDGKDRDVALVGCPFFSEAVIAKKTLIHDTTCQVVSLRVGELPFNDMMKDETHSDEVYRLRSSGCGNGRGPALGGTIQLSVVEGSERTGYYITRWWQEIKKLKKGEERGNGNLTQSKTYSKKKGEIRKRPPPSNTLSAEGRMMGQANRHLARLSSNSNRVPSLWPPFFLASGT